MSDSDDAPPAKPPKDVIYVYEQGESGDWGVIRRREEQMELGRIRAAKEGQPVSGELLRLERRPEHEQLFDVEVLHDARPAAERSGPAQVATGAYRANWERIFGRGTPDGGVPN